MDWNQNKQELLSAGFSDQEIAEEMGNQRTEMLNSGFAPKEVNEYFGQKEPDMSMFAAFTKENFQKYKDELLSPENRAKNSVGQTEVKQGHSIEDFVAALDAGWGASVSGLIKSGKIPDKVVPEDADFAMRIASKSATMMGDLPAMVTGGFFGGAAGAAVGSAVPVLGNAAGAAAGAGAGAFALPTAVRGYLMDHYEKGEFTSFKDFYERAAPIMLDTMKSGATGAVTASIPGLSVFGNIGNPVARTTAIAASELIAMTTVGAALDGQVPKAQDFVDNAALLVGFGAALKGAAKLRQIYRETGMKPSEVATLAQQDPALKVELGSDSNEIPSQLKTPAKTVELEIPQTGENGPLSSDFSPPQKIPLIENVPAETAQTKTKPIEDEAVNRVLKNVADKKQPGFEMPSFDEFYTNWVDRTNPMKLAVEAVKTGELKDFENPHKLMRVGLDAGAKVKHFYEKGTLDFNSLQENGKSLKAILDPVKSQFREFNAFLMAKRQESAAARGIDLKLMDKADQDAVISKYGKTFEKTQKEFYNWRDRALQYAVDGEILSKDAAKAMREADDSYFTISRLSEDGGKKGQKGKNPFKKLKGAENVTRIENPVLATMENTRKLIELTEENRARVAFVKLNEAAGEKSLIKEVNKTQAINVTGEEITKALDKQGFDTADITIDDATIFRKKTQALGPNQFGAMIEGKYKVYETEFPGLAESIKSVGNDQTSQNLILKIARSVTAVKKLGVTFTPDFQLKNIIRDQPTASVFSKYGGLPFKDALSVIPSLMKKDQLYWDWMKSGGANGAFFEINKNYLENDLLKLSKDTGLIDKAYNVVKTPIDMMHLMATLGEQSTRLAAFKRATEGQRTPEALIRGGMESNEITVDFQRRGLKMAALNQIVAFSNVSVQGLDRTVRAFKEDPKGVGLRAAVALTLPSVALWLVNKDDERYKELPNWQKDLFWIVINDDWQEAKSSLEVQNVAPHMKKVVDGKTYVNKGSIFRIPKPQELGLIFATIPERMLNTLATDNPDALKDLTETVLSTVTPSAVPDAAVPVIETYFNKSLFTGNKIIPYSFENNPVNPEYQYTDYTSETAKALGKMIGHVPYFKETQVANPILIDHWVQSWTGSVGKYALSVADEALIKSGAVDDPVRPASTLADIPFVKAFVVRHPSSSTQNITDFYDYYERNKQQINTIKYLGKIGEFSEMKKVMTSPETRERAFQLEEKKQALSLQAAMIHKIYRNKDLTPNDKRQLIDGVYYQMNETAKLGVKQSRDFEAAMKKENELK